MPHPTRPAAQEPTPFGINLGVGAAAMSAATIAAAVLADDPTARMIIVAAVIGVYAATVADTRASLATTLIGFGLFNGFLVNGYGELSFHGTQTLWNLSVFGVALGLGLGQRWLRQVRDTADEAGADDPPRRPTTHPQHAPRPFATSYAKDA
ncbi:DUF4118 domain-containing protein [Catellatospora aurea]|uniref:DUF4118 domain-containing protein n=1 Tax=Catellatospora aurea TaxID=1337874 RepID=A0ABW2HA19_9ACTN